MTAFKLERTVKELVCDGFRAFPQEEGKTPIITDMYKEFEGRILVYKHSGFGMYELWFYGVKELFRRRTR